jgi:hypothetical protein
VSAVTTGSLRCSLWARTQSLSPAGTAGSYKGYLMLDTPLPWPRDVSEIPEIAEMAGLLDGAGLRVQATVPSGSERRAVLYDRPDRSHWSGALTGRSAVLDPDAQAAVRHLLAGGGDVETGKDLLVCGHGRRDVCCGSSGTDLAMALLHGVLPRGARLHRTSHTGGHRFAPTFIVLPEATLWAFADIDLVRRVLEHDGDAAEVADRYRGCAALEGPRVQALEREVLREVGWDLLSWERSGRETAEGIFRLEAQSPDGPVAWEATVAPGRTLPVPDCGRPLEEARKTETEWQVTDLQRVPAA